MQSKKPKKISDAQLKESARLFGVLSEPSRLVLLRELMAGGMTVGTLVEITGMSQGNVSKHLGILQNARFVERERDGNRVRYSICDLRLGLLCDLMCERIRDDARSMASRLA